jgi:aspartyl-tRNA synthetase
VARSKRLTPKFASLTIGQSDELTAMAKQCGAKGLAFIKVENGDGNRHRKFFTEAEKKRSAPDCNSKKATSSVRGG